MKELTQEQKDFVLRVNNEAFKEAARKQQEADKEAMQIAQAEYREKIRQQNEAIERRVRLNEEAVKPLRKALTAAGIKLAITSYEGVRGSYQIGNGPEVQFDLDDFTHPEDWR